MEQPSPTVNVVVVNWNGRSHLERCLKALHAQSYGDWAVTVVDNGSQDDSVEMVRAAFPRVQVIASSRNIGFAAGNNLGIRSSRSRYVATLNNDTEAAPNWLERLVEVAATDDWVGMVASKMVFAHEPGVINSAGIAMDPVGIAWDRLGGERDDRADAVEEVFGPCAGAALYRREMLDQIGLFDEDFFAYLEDVDLAWRARLAGWRCLYAPRALVRHVHSATGIEGSSFKSYHLARNKLWCIAKNYPTPQLYLALPLILVYDFAAASYALFKRRDVAAIRGRLAAIAGLSRQLAKRGTIQGMRRVPYWSFARQLAPLAMPHAVLARYGHLH